MNAPITPPSNRMVRPGQRSRCARVAARSGMPTPAKTTCPSLSWRALRMASNSAGVGGCALSVVNGPSRASRSQDFVHSDQTEEIRPRFRTVHEPVQILLDPLDRILVHQTDVI